MAAADDALKALFGAIKGADTKLIGDVARPVTAGRMDALTRLLPTAVPEEVAAPVRLSFGEALTRPGYVPREGDWDILDLQTRLGNWSPEYRDEEAGRLLEESKNTQLEEYKVGLADQMLGDYMPDYGQSIRDITEVGPRVDEAYKLYGSSLPEYAPRTRDEFLAIVDEAAENESYKLDDNVWLSDFYDIVDQNPDAVESYEAFDEFIERLDELPEDNPLRKNFDEGLPGFTPSRDLDYDSFSAGAYRTLGTIRQLQDIGVNRDAITALLNRPRLLTRLVDRPGNYYSRNSTAYRTGKVLLDQIATLEPTIAARYADAVEALPENVNAYQLMDVIQDLEDPAVQETFLSLLPDWTDSLNELVETAKLLAS